MLKCPPFAEQQPLAAIARLAVGAFTLADALKPPAAPLRLRAPANSFRARHFSMIYRKNARTEAL